MAGADAILALTAENERLSVALEEAQEHVTQLKAVLAGCEIDQVAYTAFFGVRPAGATLLSALMSRDLCSYEALIVAMPAKHDRAKVDGRDDLKVLQVQLCMLRKVLSLHGVIIVNVRGAGYRISPEDKAKIRRLMDDGVQTPEVEA